MTYKQKGIALISVLLIVVLLSSIAYHLVSYQSATTSQTRLTLEISQLREILISSELYVSSALSQDWLLEETRIRDDLDEDWAVNLGYVQHQLGELHYRTIDLTSKININSLSNREIEVPLRAFDYLLESNGLNPQTATLWKDWVDSDSIRFVGAFYEGKEDLDWLSLPTPFRTANRQAADLTELNILSSMSDEDFAQLGRFVTVLPTSKLQVNVNTAPSTVLVSLLPKGENSVSDRRSRQNFGDVENFVEIYPAFKPLQEHLSVTSEFFEVQASVRGNAMRMDMTSRLRRDPSTGHIQIFSRRFGVTHNWATISTT